MKTRKIVILAVLLIIGLPVTLFLIAGERAIAEATNPSEGALLATHLIEYGYDIRTVPEAFRLVGDNDLHVFLAVWPRSRLMRFRSKRSERMLCS
jgi:hypothetical protein